MPFSMFNNPILFAAVAVAAIGVAIYEIISERNRRHLNNSGGRGPRPPSPPFGSNPNGRRPRPPSPPFGNNSNGRPPRPPSPPSKENNKNERDLRPSYTTKSTSYESASESASKFSDSCSRNSLRRRNLGIENDDENGVRPPNENKQNRDPRSPPPNKNNQNTRDSTPSFSPELPAVNFKDENISDSNSRNDGHFTRKVSDTTDSLKLTEDKTHSAVPINDNIEPAKEDESKKSFPTDTIKTDDKFDESNYCQNVFDKISNDTQNINENTSEEKNLIKNIQDDDDSDSSESNLLQNAEEELTNQSISNKYSQWEEVSVSNLDHGSCDSSSSSDSEEETYKEKIYNALKNNNDLENKKENHGNSNTCLSDTTQNENFIESEMCRGCEEEPINTRAHPCNHSYLCLDCALRVFRLYKKCSICHEEIVEFIEF